MNFWPGPEFYSYKQGLNLFGSGSNGDYTVKSSEDLYNNSLMLTKLIGAPMKKHSKERKTLIFNNGINTSLHVIAKRSGRQVPNCHLDNTATKKQRKAIFLKWLT